MEFTITLTPVRQFYYSDQTNYGIYACETKEKNKVMVHPKYQTFSVKGNTMRLELDKEYQAKLIEKTDKKYGKYYEIVSIFVDVPKGKENQKQYLKSLLTENQVNNIYKVYPNEDIIQLIRDDKFDYTKVHGIGKVVYEGIKNKIIENLEYQEAFEFLSGYNVTPDMIIKLVKHFKSASLLKHKMNVNPFCITSVHGIGFKKADKIAMAMGYDPKGEFRIVSAIQFTIEEDSNNGNTYSETFDVIDKVQEMIEVSSDLISPHIVETDDVIVLDGRIALKKNYYAESYIATRLKELLSNSEELNFNVEEFIQKQEEKHGITLTEQQKGFFYNTKKHNVNLLVGYAGCVDMHTEYFNGYEWKKISDYVDGEKVLQYKEDGAAELVDPFAYIKLPETKMTLVKTELGSINQCLSDEHIIIYRTSKGHLTRIPFSEVARRHEEVSKGFYGKFYTFFNYNGEGIGLADEQIRVMTMVIADGYFANSTNLCRVRLKKKRKHERIRQLLENANIPYSERNCIDGYIEFKFASPLRLKHFDSTWYHCSQHQLQVICDEVLHWDGSVDKKGRQRFASNVKESADFVQFAFSATGHRATLSERDRRGQGYKDSKYIRKSKEYSVQIAKNKWVSLFARTEDKKTPLIEVEPEDGYKYCFTVPSGMWVMRREGRICITGNCGKSQMTTLLVELLDELQISYKLLSPTGKAAKVVSNYTNRNAETIHRATGFDEDNPRFIEEEYLIVDETSMVDSQLAARLLKRCEHENLRILFIGDDFQLGSVQAGRVLYDMIQSNVIPTTKLDIVFRQKEGGILDIATKIRQNKRFLNNSDAGIFKFGNNCVIASVPQEKMEGGYRHYYNELLKKYTSDDITITTPTKKSGLGTVAVNKHVQEIINPQVDESKEKKYGFDEVVFRVNDLVMNTRNSYGIGTVNGGTVDIVNGDIGKVIDVNMEKQEVIVDFEFAVIPFEFSQLGQLLHCWASTIHKMQGDSSLAIVLIADKSHKFQLNANLLYTAATRSKEFLVILSQAETINFAMRKVESQRRKTFLGEFLVKGEI
jgi:ATP-dependent exoDNAse (exonuclease V) alpha subunit